MKTATKSPKTHPCTHKGCPKVCKSASGLKRHLEKHERNTLAAEQTEGLKPLKERKKDALMNTGKDIKPKGSNKYVNEDNLSAQDEDFCQLFASDREMFGNGVQSYIEAYEIEVVNKPDPEYPNQKTYNACKVAAHSRLTNPNFLKRINQIFEGGGLNDVFVDKQLEKVITQDAEFSSKVKGIQEYNKLKKRTVQLIEHSHSFAKFDNMSDDELEKALKDGEKFFKKK